MSITTKPAPKRSPTSPSLAVSPLDANVLWAGSADGLVHVSTDHGEAKWTPGLRRRSCLSGRGFSSIEPSHLGKGTAYLTASRYMWDDYRPYVYETADYGAHWTELTNGLPANQYVFAVREDPREPHLLFAGTRCTAYVSLNGGAEWQPLTLNLPGVQVRDFAIDTREGEVVAATHGRAFWILDSLALLEQLAHERALHAAAEQLFAPETAWLTQSYGATDFPIPNLGENPKYGATVFFNLPAAYNGKTPLSLTFVDAAGTTVRSFTLHPKSKHTKPSCLRKTRPTSTPGPATGARFASHVTAVQLGMNAFQWDLHYAPAYDPPDSGRWATGRFPPTRVGRADDRPRQVRRRRAAVTGRNTNPALP